MWQRPTSPLKRTMPKTTNGLWAKIIDFENLHQAFLEARHGKRYRLEVMRFAINLEENLTNLQNHLIWKTWAPGKQREFVVKEPKIRLIQAPPFADRVIHHALVRVIDPAFERKFIPDSFACRIDKGTQKAVFRVQHFLQVAKRNWGDDFYVLKADSAATSPASSTTSWSERLSARYPILARSGSGVRLSRATATKLE